MRYRWAFVCCLVGLVLLPWINAAEKDSAKVVKVSLQDTANSPNESQSTSPNGSGQGSQNEPDQDPPDGEPPTIQAPPVIGVLDNAVTGATTTQRLQSRFGGSVSVITREQIQRQRKTNIGQVLQGIRGVDVVQQGPRGGISSVFMRGANSQHTKVLLDGIPINDPSNPSRAFDFSTLSVDQVERIEVLRGPQSSLYGSDAMGGVINIITRRGEGPTQVRVTGEGGSFGTHRESLHVSGGSNTHHFSISGSYLQTDGFSAAAERLGNTEADGYKLGTIAGRFGWLPSDNLELEFFFRYIDADAEIDDAAFSLGSPPTDDPFRRNLSEIFLTRVQLRHLALDGLVEQIVSFNLTDYQRDDRDDSFPFTTQGQTRNVQYQANLQLTDANLFSVGANYLAEDAASQSGFGSPSATQFVFGGFLQDQVQINENWNATVSARWDNYNFAGDAQTYRVTSVYELPERLTRFKGSLGTGFRAPALAENIFPFGNPALRPERSRGWDIGIEQPWEGYGDWLVGATYFRNRFRDLILFDLGTFTLENIGRARTHGFEYYGEWRVGQTIVAMTMTHTDSFDGDTGQPLARRPKDKGSIRITRLFCCGRGAVTLTGLFVGKRTDSRDASVELRPYQLVNLSGHWDLTDSLRVHGRMVNLLDDDYEEATGYATAGISGYAGLTWTY